jgi:para-nitrobenzyl esterase
MRDSVNEHIHSIGHPELEKTTEEELKSQVSKAYGADKADAIIAAYRRMYPKSNALDVLSFLHSGGYRHRTTTQAERKMALGAAPAYIYYFTWQTPVLDGRPRAFHCAELPFVFNNTDRAAAMTGGGDDARALGAKMSAAWVAFARSGDPNHSGLPKWPVYNKESGPVMVFDNHCEVKNDPDREARKLLL